MSKGILRQPGSVRAEREGGVHFDEPESVVAPEWLGPNQQSAFHTLVDELAQAKVPIKQIDVHAIANVAYTIASIAEWAQREQEATAIKDKIECSKQVTRFQRDCQKWLEVLCASPAARARIGMKATPKKTGTVANLLALKHENAGS